jgi:DNA-binding FadR family transcriptional regulator
MGMNATLDHATFLATSGSVTVDIANLIGREIVSGRVPQGATIPNEAEISARFSVGRSAVREAVKMLAAKGLVESRPRRGTQVLPAKTWNFFDREVLFWLRDGAPEHAIILELLELRLGVEPQAAALAARKGSADQIKAVGSAYASMQAAAEGKVDPVQADCSFHEAIIVATANRFFQPFGTTIRTAISVTAATTNAIFGHSVGDLVAHGRVLTALEAGDPQGAHDSMKAMLGAVLDAVARAQTKTQVDQRTGSGARLSRG